MREPVGRAMVAVVGESIDLFEGERPRLLRLAYRMLGSLADAEDVIQDAFLRWSDVVHAPVERPGAFLTRIVTRLCLDQLKSARARREVYVGPWLPEPIVDHPDFAEEEGGGFALDLTVGLLLAMERLSPLERAAFLLHDAFDLGFDEIARVLGRTPAACRQLAARARVHLGVAAPRFCVSREDGERIAVAFRAASARGDPAALAELLAADARFVSDGGGKRAAALNIVSGRDRLIRLLAGLARKRGEERPFVVSWVNGMPGFVTDEADGLPQTTALEIDAATGLVAAIYVTRNPDKLRHITPVPAAASE